MTKKTLKEYEAEWIMEKLKGINAKNTTTAQTNYVGTYSHGSDLLEEINKAIVKEIMSAIEDNTPKIEVVSGLVHIVKNGTFLDELDGALKNDRRRRT